MHQKKSEVQIGKESVGVSSDFNPSPPLQYQKHPHHRHQFYPQIEIDISPPQQRTGPPQVTPPPSLSKQKHLHPHAQPPLFKSHNAAFFSVTVAAKSAAFRALRRVRRQRALLLLAVPLLYLYFLVSRSFLLDLLSAIAFSAALVFSLNLAFPLPLRSIRLKSPSAVVARPAPQLPVFWTIGSRPKSEKRVASGCWVQVFGNGDVYEGEFHRGKCSGSGVYYYSRSGRYEGDWVDGKYDGYGVETWARGSRYRGCYRQGLRHGFGVYRFYTGDVYAGEWSNGQSHGCGVHTCEDGSRYVGEFKWGVKHGLGHYHFRCMVLGYIILQMAIYMKEPGMKVEDKDLACIHLEMVKPNPVTGKMDFLTFQALKALLIQFLLLVYLIPKSSMQCRMQDEQQRKHMKWQR
ncbi:uncharacterized protein LOC108329387 isoform X2 [Vigna angularis]|uniref:uncharacterized protein LOC108329387 isoform X2 n=1 Tax=Phaseolus angularis TaxID=3914 RepID=UPI0022B32AC7|nr:uncharacterized protein LOC108329387 isoform X2 [Vigna angularis]